MKTFLLLLLTIFSFTVKAQHVDSIYVHLYTDSLKKGTYNYINIDGLLSNGRYLPLDSSQIQFSASAGKFYGNTLFIDKNFAEEKVNIKVVLKANPALYKEFVMYIKKKADDENLKSVEEIMSQPAPRGKRKGG
ncbi:MAG: hypothetical protein JST86_14925 [Bacteroidetes bacterium]|nr:hypothetical protein [Bacteroidota bacterium]